MSAKRIPTACKECDKTLTTTKYCKPCEDIVRARHRRLRLYNQKQLGQELKAKRKAETGSYDVKVDPKWLTRGNISIGNRDCKISGEA